MICRRSGLLDSEVFFSFMFRLTTLLDREDPDWRQKTVFQLDGAGYHRSATTIQVLQSLDLEVVISAPYAFDGAPIEKLFAITKQGLLNKDGQRTGRKQFGVVAGLID